MNRFGIIDPDDSSDEHEDFIQAHTRRSRDLIIQQTNAAKPSVCDEFTGKDKDGGGDGRRPVKSRPYRPPLQDDPPVPPNIIVGPPCGCCSILGFLLLIVAVAFVTAKWDDIVTTFPPLKPPNTTTIPVERICRLEKAVASLQKDFKELKNSIDDSTIGKFPEKILEQIMDVEVGTLKGKPLTLRNLILAVKDITDNQSYHDDEKLIKIMDERLEKFKQKIVICGPHIPKGQWCISADGTADLTRLKEELTTFLILTIKQELNRIPPRSDVGDIVKRAIDKYDADKTALPDLALEPGGGRIITCGKTVMSTHKNSAITFMGVPVWSKINEANTIIQPGIVPGECWAFEGEGLTVIQLVGPAIITGVSLEHLPRVNSPSGRIDEAPKDFQVSGFMDYNDQRTEFNFGEYQYLDNFEPLQYFPVKRKSDMYFPYVQLKVRSNQNYSKYTCIYRFRVHGNLFGMTASILPIIIPKPPAPVPGGPGPDPEIPCVQFD